MIKIDKILLGLFLVISLNSANAQYQSLFGSTQTSWNSIKGNLWGTGTDSLTATIDTIINGKIYKKILYYDLTTVTPQIESIIGYLREDSILGKAWYFTSLDTTEQLIMDLNLNLGDTFYVGGVWNSYVGYHPVDSIWVQLGRKYIRIDNEINPSSGGSNNEKVTFIEGIGTNIGIGYQDLNYIDNSPYLLCSYKDDNTEFQNTHPIFIGKCDYTTVGMDDTKLLIEIKIYPNPSINELTVEYLGEFSNNLKIEIHNTNGKLVLKKELNQLKRTTINIQHIPVGIYFIVIKNKQEVIASQKWVKRARN